jgi:ubiquinone biosynthesis protein Coq4
MSHGIYHNITGEQNCTNDEVYLKIFACSQPINQIMLNTKTKVTSSLSIELESNRICEFHDRYIESPGLNEKIRNI